MNIGDVIRAGIQAGKTTEDILADVRKAFPQAQTKAASVAWYRSQMRRSTTADAVNAAFNKGKRKPAEADEPPLRLAGSKAQQGHHAFVHGKGFVPKDAGDVAAAKVSEGSPDSGPLYTVGGIKVTQGKEGPGFVCALMRDGKKVAEVADYGDGGPVHWDWFDKNDQAEVVALNYKDEEVAYKGTREEAMFHLFCRHLPKWRLSDTLDTGDDREMHTSPDMYVEQLVNDAMLVKELRRLTKGKIAMIEGGKLYTLKPPKGPTDVAIANVKATSPTAIILNEMTEADALAELRKLQ